MFYIVYISTTKYHYRGNKFDTLKQAYEYMRDYWSHSFGQVIRDGLTGKRYCLNDARHAIEGGVK